MAERITIRGTSEKHGDYLIWEVLVDGMVVCSMFGGASATGALVFAKYLDLPEGKRDTRLSEMQRYEA